MEKDFCANIYRRTRSTRQSKGEYGKPKSVQLDFHGRSGILNVTIIKTFSHLIYVLDAEPRWPSINSLDKTVRLFSSHSSSHSLRRREQRKGNFPVPKLYDYIGFDI